MLSAVIPLDHRYKLPSLGTQAINTLTTCYTVDFESWINGSNSSRWKPDPIHAKEAILLARLTNTSTIRPTAFHELAQLTLSVILKGKTGSDGTVHRLPGDDLELCLQL